MPFDWMTRLRPTLRNHGFLIWQLLPSSSLSLVSSLGGAKTRGRNEKHISGNAQQIMLVKFCTGPSCRGPEVLSHTWPCNFWLFIFTLSKYSIFRYLKTFPVAVWLGLANKTTCFGWGNESAWFLCTVCWYSSQRHWEHLRASQWNDRISLKTCQNRSYIIRRCSSEAWVEIMIFVRAAGISWLIDWCENEMATVFDNPVLEQRR